jgi:hypothetical protein
MSQPTPAGRERRIQFLGGAAIDGAPVAYLIVLAAVVAVLAFFPLSAVLGMGGSFPLYQGVLGLLGWALGPIAGAVAGGIGALVGVFLAPHTVRVPFVSVAGAMAAAFAAGAMVGEGRRKNWWLGVFLFILAAYLYYIGRALFLNQISLWAVIAGTFINWSSLLLYALPTRPLIARWIRSSNLPRLAAGLALGSWMVYGLAHALSGAITYHMFNWPEEVWISLIPLTPLENLTRAAVGVIIGGGVIAGMRAIGLVKPEHAVY